MAATTAQLEPGTDTDIDTDADADADARILLNRLVEIADRAGARLLARYDPAHQPADLDGLLAALQANEQASNDGLRAALTALRPHAGWIEGELEAAPLPDGEWWAVDAVEGNINHVQGTGEWCVSITLVRDGRPVIAVVRQPVGDLTYTAVRGAGAMLNGTPLHVSAKTDLRTAIVGTGQAEVGQVDTYRRIGDSITAMLHRTLLVQATVPSTFPMLLVAAGRTDAFWLYRPTLPGVAAGALFVTEAGGSVTRIDGTPWTPGSPDILATTPHLHSAAVDALGSTA